MRKLVGRFSEKKGLPPGALVHIGKKRVEKARIRVIDYTRKEISERDVRKIEDCFPYRDSRSITWINIDGVHDAELMRKVREHFGIHPLIMEDVMNTGQRPKMEDMGKYIFLVLRMLYHDEAEIKSEQVSIIMGKRFVISFQEREGDVFDSVRNRIRNSRGRLRRSGTDYLAYVLLDAVVDGYFSLLEWIGEKTEALEEELIKRPGPDTLKDIYRLKREMIFLRKSVWPLREAVSGLGRTDSRLVDEETKVFIRDVYDHTIQVIDTVETLREMVGGMLDTYLSSVSNRMNEVMKVLTIIATIFIPLTFIAGIYGMNFQYMPELGWEWGYYAVWSVMAVIAIVMLFYFRGKKWL
jgi:magnesium transporter